MEWMAAYEDLRAEFAKFIHASPQEVAIVTSASAGINAIASALHFEKRPTVVMGEYEFPTMAQIWLAQQPRGAHIQFLDGIGEAITSEQYESTVDEQTLVVPLTRVSFLNGFRSDVARITTAAHRQGALVFLDDFQDCGTRPVDVKALGIDFYVTGTLKYLLGPPGVAFLYVRQELIPSLTPTITSWMAQCEPFAFSTKRLDPAPDARRFEGGSPSIPNIYMARRALSLLQEIGLQNAAEQIGTLTQAFLRGAHELDFDVKTPSSSVGPLVVVRSVDAPTLLAKLAAAGVVASARRDGIRFGLHVYNTLGDVNHALEVLRANRELIAAKNF